MALPSVLGTSHYVFLKHSGTLSDVPWNPLLGDLQAGSPLPATLVHGVSNCSSKPPESSTGGVERGVHGLAFGPDSTLMSVKTCRSLMLVQTLPELCLTMYCNIIEELTVHLSPMPEHQHAFFVKVERRWFPIFPLPPLLHVPFIS